MENYRAALPPDTYILDLQDRRAKRVREKPFTVLVDIAVDTGIRLGRLSSFVKPLLRHSLG